MKWKIIVAVLLAHVIQYLPREKYTLHTAVMIIPLLLHLPPRVHRRDFNRNALAPNPSASLPFPHILGDSGSNLLPKQPLNGPASYLLALNLTIPLEHLNEWAF